VDRLCAAVTGALLLLMVTGLAANTVLPRLGVERPLGRPAVLWFTHGLLLVLAALAYRHRRERHALELRVPRPEELLCAGLAAGAVAMSAAGAVRLNNGRGGGLTHLMLVVLVATVAVLVVRHQQFGTTSRSVVLYLVSLALLLMTSLRGWYTTGHDVQAEFELLRLTKTVGLWDMDLSPDAYNACLSITILPTVIGHWTLLPDPYVFKLVYQALFALTPVMVYRLACRAAPEPVALVAALYFLGFVTFFQDMPMLNRQEIALMFLATGLLLALDTSRPTWERRTALVVLSAGMVLSHYSTTYVTLVVLGIAWVLRGGTASVTWARRLPERLRRRKVPTTPDARPASVVTLGVIAIIASTAYLWSSPVTHTAGGLARTMSSAVESIRGLADGQRSSDTGYSLLGGERVSPTQRLDDYRRHALSLREGPADAYVPWSPAAQPIDAVADQELPLTVPGRWLAQRGVDVVGMNSVVRQSSSWLLQLLALVGLAVVVLSRRRPVAPPREFVLLALASTGVLVLQVLVPVLSVDYGLLRAFQQSLLFLGVFLVAGTAALLPSRLGEWRVRLAGIVSLLLLASSTGVVTQALGGYGPQLHLNNSGRYYDLYYTHTEELAAVSWLRQHREERVPVQADRFLFWRNQSLATMDGVDTIFPTDVLRDSYVLLGWTNVRRDESTVNVDGDLVTYRYPMTLLDDHKDLVYANGGARVYR
jgi:uncharacterized membrane protein